MKRENNAKLWLADFSSDEARGDFFREVYDKDGDATCAMWDDLGMDWFDHDFQEVIPHDWRDYVRSIARDPIPSTWLEGRENTALLLFDLDGPVAAARSGIVLRYLGEFRVKS